MARALCLFNGVRPSSGAATSARSSVLDLSQAPSCSIVAAPEDGRAPLNSGLSPRGGSVNPCIPKRRVNGSNSSFAHSSLRDGDISPTLPWAQDSGLGALEEAACGSKVDRNVRPHPCPLPQKREKIAPR